MGKGKKFRLDLRKELRRIAAVAQAENAQRLTIGVTVDGDTLAPRAQPNPKRSAPSRLKISGQSFGRKVLSKIVGVLTGEMLKDLTKRANARITRTAMRIIPSSEVFKRFAVFNNGSKKTGQPARPFSGMSSRLVKDASEELTKAARDQLGAHIAQASRQGRNAKGVEGFSSLGPEFGI